MKTKSLFPMLMLIAGVVFLTSCTKEGPVGPQGPAGKDGKDGNANVTSVIFTISSWNNDGVIWYKSIFDSRITNNIINNGDVRVFIESPIQQNIWLNMPLILPYDGYIRIFNYIVGVNQVEIKVFDSDNLLPSEPGTHRIKVVVIDGISLTKAKKYNVNLNDYESIRNFFNLSD